MSRTCRKGMKLHPRGKYPVSKRGSSEGNSLDHRLVIPDKHWSKIPFSCGQLRKSLYVDRTTVLICRRARFGGFRALVLSLSDILGLSSERAVWQLLKVRSSMGVKSTYHLLTIASMVLENIIGKQKIAHVTYSVCRKFKKRYHWSNESGYTLVKFVLVRG